MNDGSHAYTYDAENRVIQVDSGATATYAYDAFGQRSAKTSGGVSVSYFYDLSGHEVSEVNSSAAWTRMEIYTGGKHLATYSGGTSGSTTFNHTDWLGTERVRTNMSGTACETVMSLPYGDQQSTSGSCGDPSPMHFTGKQRDSESNLDDFGARYYTSTMGRWMTPDWSAREQAVPYVDLHNPQSLNLYAYVGNNPTTVTDPDGHAQELEPGANRAPGCPTGSADLAGGTCGVGSTTANNQNAPSTLPPDQAQITQSDLKGPYVADLKSKEIAPLLDPNHKSSDKDIVGNGQCVTACSKFSGVPGNTKEWRAGAAVTGDGDIKPGTAIATFDSNGRYTTGQDKNSAIFLSNGTKGSIWVLDQWPAHPDNNTSAHPPQPREVRFDDGKTLSNSANAYHVIMVAPE